MAGGESKDAWNLLGAVILGAAAVTGGLYGAFGVADGFHWNSGPMMGIYVLCGLLLIPLAGLVRGWPFPFKPKVPETATQEAEATTPEVKATTWEVRNASGHMDFWIRNTGPREAYTVVVENSDFRTELETIGPSSDGFFTVQTNPSYGNGSVDVTWKEQDSPTAREFRQTLGLPAPEERRR
jgi:hypothetical protein